MFFDKNEDNEVKIVDEVLSNDSFDKLSVDLVDIDFTLVGGDGEQVWRRERQQPLSLPPVSERPG